MTVFIMPKEKTDALVVEFEELREQTSEEIEALYKAVLCSETGEMAHTAEEAAQAIQGWLDTARPLCPHCQQPVTDPLSAIIGHRGETWHVACWDEKYPVPDELPF
jgi:hypothetical protein